MTRPETTKLLSQLTERYINPNHDPRIYWAREVTFGYGTGNQVRVDYMKFEPVNNTVSGIEHGDFYCFEIKSSEADFRSKNGHNQLGDYNYYVMPYEVFCRVKDEIPWNIGVLCPGARMTLVPDLFDGFERPEYCVDHLESKKKAQRADRKYSLQEMLLMMFRSCARDRRTEE